MRCLVTGVAGFIGSHLAERLISDGHEVCGIDAFIDFYPRALKEANLSQLRASGHFHLVEGDLTTLPLDRLLADREWVFHQAAQAGVRTSWGQNFDLYLSCNVTATQRLLEAAINAPELKRFVYASSSSVYGDVTEPHTIEAAPTKPVSPYGVTKLAAEHLSFLYWRNYTVPTVALRYFTVYGPRQRPDMALHRFGKALVEGDVIPIFGDGTQIRDFTYVSDIVEANLLAARAEYVEGQVFNIAGGAPVRLREVINTMADLSGRKPHVDYRESFRGDVRDTHADISKARHILGYSPRVSLREGLSKELTYLATLYSPVLAH